MEIFKINVHSPLYYYGIDLYLSWQKLMKYKCVIFDCDGVLVDSEKISAKVLVDMALESGLSIDMDDAIERFTGKSFRSILSYIEQQIDVELKDNFETEFRRRTYKLFEKELQPVEGIKQVVLKKYQFPFG